MIYFSEHAKHRLKERYSIFKELDLKIISSKLDFEYTFIKKLKNNRQIRQVKHNGEYIQAVLQQHLCITILEDTFVINKEVEEVKEELENKCRCKLNDFDSRLEDLNQSIFLLRIKLSKYKEIEDFLSLSPIKRLFYRRKKNETNNS